MDRNFHFYNGIFTIQLPTDGRARCRIGIINRNLSTLAIFERGGRVGRLRDNVCTSSMARWKARVRLPIRQNWTFFASSYRWGATRQNLSKLTAFWRGWVCLSQNFRRTGGPWEYFLVSTKLDAFCYLTVQTAPYYTVAGSTAWNSLPDYLRDPTRSVDSFRRDLNFFLFSFY